CRGEMRSLTAPPSSISTARGTPASIIDAPQGERGFGQVQYQPGQRHQIKLVAKQRDECSCPELLEVPVTQWMRPRRGGDRCSLRRDCGLARRHSLKILLQKRQWLPLRSRGRLPHPLRPARGAPSCG